MSSQVVRTFFPKTRLSELVKRGGGLARDEAVAKAEEGIESMRGDADVAIMEAMAVIDSVLARAQRKAFDATDLREILQQADLVLTVAGTLGYPALGRVMQSMCDITDTLLREGLNDAAPIAVHAQSMRLMAPGSAVLSDVETEHVLGELALVLKKYNCVPIGSADR